MNVQEKLKEAAKKFTDVQAVGAKLVEQRKEIDRKISEVTDELKRLQGEHRALKQLEEPEEEKPAE